MTKNDKKIRLLYLLELQIFDNQKLAITASESDGLEIAISNHNHLE